ncbi:proteinase-activated receptor 3-like [Colossoma macropomum]|uniref:proteinase-activated receptor 3-like n=1 Tax=Colossoma macropomum TaxID=42526 RepID=UPI001864ADA5|nr:proteinase-activated receptor 3-like [Colossoma macropomum]
MGRTGNLTANLTVNATSSFDNDELFITFFPIAVVVPIVGFPTNIYVLWTLFRKPSLCSTSDIFTINLALLDALCCLLQPIEVIDAIYSSLNEVVLRSVLLNQFAGPLFQTCTCVDCYIGVIHPIVFLKFKMPKFRLSLCAFIWTAMVCLSLCIYYMGDDTRGLECMAGCLIGELGIMLFCNVQVLRVLKQRGPGSRQIHPAKLRAIQTVLTLLIMVMIHYITSTVNFLMISYKQVPRISLFTIISFMIACISSCNHPFFYLLRARKIYCFFGQKSQAKAKKPKAGSAVATVQS